VAAAGAALEDVLADLDLEHRRRLLIMVSQRIHRLHAAGIFHGDLHFANVFVEESDEEDPSITIIDFGKSQDNIQVPPVRPTLPVPAADRDRRGCQSHAPILKVGAFYHQVC
jgi:hypothetical protein